MSAGRHERVVPAPRREAVILVHGIRMLGLAMVPLQRRLGRAGYDARILAYPSLRAAPAENAQRLRAQVLRLKADVVHLVGHSLGGLVVLHLLASRPPAKVGRCVLLGTPAAGSARSCQVEGARPSGRNKQQASERSSCPERRHTGPRGGVESAYGAIAVPRTDATLGRPRASRASRCPRRRAHGHGLRPDRDALVVPRHMAGGRHVLT